MTSPLSQQQQTIYATISHHRGMGGVPLTSPTGREDQVATPPVPAQFADDPPSGPGETTSERKPLIAAEDAQKEVKLWRMVDR